MNKIVTIPMYGKTLKIQDRFEVESWYTLLHIRYYLGPDLDSEA